MVLILMATCLFFDVVYIICNRQNKNIIGLIAKTLAALCFIAIGYLAYKNHNSDFNKLILIGLVLDGIGDLLLALRNLLLKQVMFFIGALSFLAGHIFYIKAQFPINNYYQLQCIIAGVVIGGLLMYLFDNVCRLKKSFKLLGIVYCVMISMMACLSVGIYLTNKVDTNLLFMLGSILFVSSDFILILYNFSKKEKWMHPVYSILYFVAQLLISYSLYII